MGSFVAAVIIAYYPNRSEFGRNISRHFEEWDQIYLVNNGPESCLQEMVDCDFIQTPNDRCVFVANGENIGLAAAMNQGWRLARDNGHEWITFWDQDSFIPRRTRHCVETIINQEPRVYSMFGLNYYHPSLIAGGKMRIPENKIQSNYELIETDDVITSGSIVSMRLLESLGGFNDWMFIDLVDTEFSTRAILSNHRIARVPEWSFLHTLGGCIPKKFFNKTVYFENYNDIRTFYSYRNLIWFFKKYGFLKVKKVKVLVVYAVTRWAKIILYDTARVKRSVSVVRGIVAGLFAKS